MSKSMFLQREKFLNVSCGMIWYQLAKEKYMLDNHMLVN
jgi:hypothetical protein